MSVECGSTSEQIRSKETIAGKNAIAAVALGIAFACYSAIANHRSYESVQAPQRQSAEKPVSALAAVLYAREVVDAGDERLVFVDLNATQKEIDDFRLRKPQDLELLPDGELPVGEPIYVEVETQPGIHRKVKLQLDEDGAILTVNDHLEYLPMYDKYPRTTKQTTHEYRTTKFSKEGEYTVSDVSVLADLGKFFGKRWVPGDSKLSIDQLRENARNLAFKEPQGEETNRFVITQNDEGVIIREGYYVFQQDRRAPLPVTVADTPPPMETVEPATDAIIEPTPTAQE